MIEHINDLNYASMHIISPSCLLIPLVTWLARLLVRWDRIEVRVCCL